MSLLDVTHALERDGFAVVPRLMSVLAALALVGCAASLAADDDGPDAVQAEPDARQGQPERAAEAPATARPASTSASPSAEPTPKQRARVLFIAGTKAYQEGRYEDARDAFLRAYDQFPAPELLYNIAQTHHRLGNCDEARAYFQRFLAARPDAPMAQQITERMDACASRQAAP